MSGSHSEILGKVVLWAGTDLPAGWQVCKGQPFSDGDNYDDLKNLLSEVCPVDDDCDKVFPNFSNRFALFGDQFGVYGGEDRVALTAMEMPAHRHQIRVSEEDNGSDEPKEKFYAIPASGAKMYSSGTPDTTLNSSVLQLTGAEQPHENLPPFLPLYYIICANGQICKPNASPVEPIGSVEMFVFDAAEKLPNYYYNLNGTLLNKSTNPHLFEKIGYTFSTVKNQTDFALPDLTDRVLMGIGSGPGLTPRSYAETGGEKVVELSLEHIPAHTHKMLCGEEDATHDEPDRNFPAIAQDNIYDSSSATSTFASTAVSLTGAGVPHNNLPPYLTIHAAMHSGNQPISAAVPSSAQLGRITFVASSDESPRPGGWMECNGKVLRAADYPDLVDGLSHLFTHYDLETGTLSLPDLRGRSATGSLSTRDTGVPGGAEQVILGVEHLPPHTHDIFATNDDGNEDNPSGNVLAMHPLGRLLYSSESDGAVMHAQSVSQSGGNQAHNNLAPFMVLRPYICALKDGCNRASFDCFDVQKPKITSTPPLKCIKSGLYGSEGNVIFDDESESTVEQSVSINGTLTVKETASLKFTPKGTLDVNGCVDVKGTVQFQTNQALSQSFQTFTLMRFNCSEPPSIPEITPDIFVDRVCEIATADNQVSSTSFEVLVSLDDSNCGDDSNDASELLWLLALPIVCLCCVIVVIAILIGFALVHVANKKKMAMLQSAIA